jgi:hypothetical protein
VDDPIAAHGLVVLSTILTMYRDLLAQAYMVVEELGPRSHGSVGFYVSHDGHEETILFCVAGASANCPTPAVVCRGYSAL